jgi:tetratricopeptide (TPR) repeat protein
MTVSFVARMTLPVLIVAGLGAQTADTKQPKPKSNKEVEALNALFTAQEPGARIAAAEGLLTKFADTEFKGLALYMATDAAEQANNFEQVMIYGERTVQADPKNFGAMLIMCRNLAANTKEFDLDKEEKLGKAEKYCNSALPLVPNATKMNPAVTDEQWAGVKKDFEGQVHAALGMVAMARKKPDAAITEFQKAMELQPQKDPTVMVRLATALTDAGKYDEAIALCDEVSAIPDAPASVKQVAGQTKLKAATAKAKK